MCLAIVVLAAPDARANDPAFGAYDIPTVFFINKSDDKNRVDYAIRLDHRCAPASDEAVFPYWREFEKAPPVRTHSLGIFEYVAYGVSEQRITRFQPAGGQDDIRLKPYARPIAITTSRAADGRCTSTARTTIAGVPGAVLQSIYVKLAGFMSVSYVLVRGRHPRTGAPLEERINKQ